MSNLIWDITIWCSLLIFHDEDGMWTCPIGPLQFNSCCVVSAMSRNLETSISVPEIKLLPPWTRTLWTPVPAEILMQDHLIMFTRKHSNLLLAPLFTPWQIINSDLEISVKKNKFTMRPLWGKRQAWRGSSATPHRVCSEEARWLQNWLASRKLNL